MRLLIYILALMSAFFTPVTLSSDGIDYTNLRPAKVSFKTEMSCNKLGQQIIKMFQDGDPDRESFRSVCHKYIKDNIEVKYTGQYCPPSSPRYTFTTTKVSFSQSIYKAYEAESGLACTNDYVLNYDLAAVKGQTVELEECPPVESPNYTVEVPRDGGMMCAQPAEPKDCPAGYHSKAVSKALGSSECVPKECPTAGTGENLASTPMTGGAPFSGGGMYCNDGCAYSVNAEQISSDKYAVGTSQGAACGDKPYDNKKLADEGDGDGCAISNADGVDLLVCTTPPPETPEPDPIDNDDSKVDEDETPEIPKQNCVDGDGDCNIKNVETEIENSSNKIIDNDNELHNKKIDADTKNTQTLLNIMESVDTSILQQTNKDDLLHAITISKFNELIDAVNGLETGGSGGGNGTGNGTGNGDGDGDGECEGSALDCVPISGAELPTETVNLGQYADQYDDWLPNAELPEKSCVTLTNGLNLCLDFSSIILIFKAFSALLVISALIHSGKIIAGAF